MIVLLVDAAPLEPVSVLFGFDVKIIEISDLKHAGSAQNVVAL